jgi:dihydropteroate synthase
VGRVPQFRITNSFPANTQSVFSWYQFSIDGWDPLSAKRFEKALQNIPEKIGVRVIQKKRIYSVVWTLEKNTFPKMISHLRKNVRIDSHLIGEMQNGFQCYQRSITNKKRSTHPIVSLFQHRTCVMGILNVTTDSFSDGGLYRDKAKALEHALQMQCEGAHIIDVGAESSRPGARPISADEEKKRLFPIIRILVRKLRIPVSIDTYKASVAEAMIQEGASMINDISAFGLDPAMPLVLARLKTPVLLMHMKGNPRTMQQKPRYENLIAEITRFFKMRIQKAKEAGISEDKIFLDPGFGFGKTHVHNIQIIQRLQELSIFGRPIILGPSRKSTLGAILGGAPVSERQEATLAAIVAAVLSGAHGVRVHDVRSAVRAVKMADAIRYTRFAKELAHD